MKKETAFKVHYTRVDKHGDNVRGFSRVMAETPEQASNKVREAINGCIVLKTKLDKEK